MPTLLEETPSTEWGGTRPTSFAQVAPIEWWTTERLNRQCGPIGSQWTRSGRTNISCSNVRPLSASLPAMSCHRALRVWK